MTQYSVYIPNGNRWGAVEAVSYYVRLNRVDIRNNYSNDSVFFVGRGTGSASGGSTLTPTPLRAGGPDATAECRAGNVSIGGTESNIAFQSITHGSSGTINIPSDMIIAPGGTFYVNFLASTGGDTLAGGIIYFEELKLSFHV